jgi:hypothetical protein
MRQGQRGLVRTARFVARTKERHERMAALLPPGRYGAALLLSILLIESRNETAALTAIEAEVRKLVPRRRLPQRVSGVLHKALSRLEEDELVRSVNDAREHGDALHHGKREYVTYSVSVRGRRLLRSLGTSLRKV